MIRLHIVASRLATLVTHRKHAFSTRTTLPSRSRDRDVGELQNKIISIFQSNDADVTNQINNLILNRTNRLSTINVATILHRCSKNRVKIRENSLSILSHQLKISPDRFRSSDIGMAVYGLHQMSCENKSVLNLVDTISIKVEESNASISMEGAASALYGLKGMKCSTREVKRLLRSLINKIKTCRDPFSMRAINSSFCAFHNMTGESEEVRELLAILTEKLKSCPEPLNCKAISTVMYSLRRMNAESEEMRQLLRVLSTVIESSSENFDASAVGQCIYGLQAMASDTPGTMILPESYPDQSDMK